MKKTRKTHSEREDRRGRRRRRITGSLIGRILEELRAEALGMNARMHGRNRGDARLEREKLRMRRFDRGGSPHGALADSDAAAQIPQAKESMSSPREPRFRIPASRRTRTRIALRHFQARGSMARRFRRAEK